MVGPTWQGLRVPTSPPELDEESRADVQSSDEMNETDLDAADEDTLDDAPVVETISRGVRRRSRRRLGPRPKTLARHELRRAVESARGLNVYPDDDERPKTRDDCRDGCRPCPWVACKHHLYLNVNPATGAITFSFPDKEPWELAETCALDVADRGGLTLEEVGEIMNLTRERIRQVEVHALIVLRSIKATQGLG